MEAAAEGGISGGAESRGLQLLKLLLQCAEAVVMDHLAEAHELLLEISKLASPFGTSSEHVAAYFAKALHAQIESNFFGVYSLLTLKSFTLAWDRRISQAFQAYNSIDPLVKFSHFIANQAIFEALDCEDRIHVIDLDINIMVLAGLGSEDQEHHGGQGAKRMGEVKVER